MKQNVGAVDRAIRIVLGLGVVSLVFWGPYSVWGWLGLLLFMTGTTGFSPLYYFLDISTRPFIPKKY